MPKQPIAIPYKLREALQRGLTHYKIIFVSAGTGWGKTTTVNKLLEKQNAARLSLRKKFLPSYFSKERLIVMDDFQELPPQVEQKFQEILRKSQRGQRFVLISRGPLPEYLSLYEATGALIQLGRDDLALDTECLSQLVQARGLTFSTEDIQRLRDETGGCPVAVNILLLMLSAGQPFRQSTIDVMRGKMGAYINETTLRLLDPKAQKLLTELSLFGEFDQKLAEMLTGDRGILSALEALRHTAGLIQRKGDVWRIVDQRFLIPYLRQKILAEYPEEHIRSVHLAGGRWYALRQDFHNALYHYQQADSREDIMDALAQNARLHPGVGTYYEMRDYYNLLTEEEILGNPDMICAMSMLRSMTFEPEESEKWYEAMKEYIQRMDRRDSDYRRILGLQFYLEIGLPHRGTVGLTKKIPAVAKLLTSKTVTLPEMSVTSNLPSLLRGGKDFSEWVPKDRRLYNTIRIPVEAVLGRYGVGLGDIALTESLLEKGEDVSGRFLVLTALQEKLRAKGTPEMEFVLTALLVRTLLTAGNVGKAKELLLRFRAEIAERRVSWLLPNIDAMRCRLSLMDESTFAAVWYAELAPNEATFYGMECYRYLTKVRCYIKHREYHVALLLLGRVLDYTRRYARPLDMLETLILISMCRYRMENEDWREHFAAALKVGRKYGYVAAFTREGAALLPLLERYDHKSVKPDYWEKILSGAVVQEGYYSQYLQPLDNLLTHLTQTETMILRLISQDKSNEEICALLDIKLPTVKTHVRNLFKKLKVSSRAEAQKAAKRLGLI